MVPEASRAMTVSITICDRVSEAVEAVDAMTKARITTSENSERPIGHLLM
jgi:hypothetical protein